MTIYYQLYGKNKGFTSVTSLKGI